MRRTIAAVTLAVLLAACAGKPASEGTLWDALGREAGVGQVIDGTVRRAHADPTMSDLFRDTDDAYLKERLLEQIWEAAGGGCTYTGLSMEEAHSGMQITDTEFGAFVGHLVAAMDDARVPKDTQQKLIALLAPMQPDIVGK